MTEETKLERKFVTVTFPSRPWTIRECEAFEEFLRFNGPSVTRIFRKLGVIRT